MYKSKVKLTYMGIRIPEWVRNAISADATIYGLTDSEIVRQILEKHFSGRAEKTTIEQPVEQPEQPAETPQAETEIKIDN